MELLEPRTGSFLPLLSLGPGPSVSSLTCGGARALIKACQTLEGTPGFVSCKPLPATVRIFLLTQQFCRLCALKPLSTFWLVVQATTSPSGRPT